MLLTANAKFGLLEKGRRSTAQRDPLSDLLNRGGLIPQNGEEGSIVILNAKHTRPGHAMCLLKHGPAHLMCLFIFAHGKQSHGARPWDGVDPIVVSAQIVLALQTIASRQVDVTLAPSIISVGRITGGVRYNVIPDDVAMEGTIRTFDPEMRKQIHQRIENTARGIAGGAGAEIEFELELGYPALINSAELYDQMLPTLKRVAVNVEKSHPHTTAEDFAYFAQATPGLYVFLNSGPMESDPKYSAPNHSPFFNMYEPNLETGVRIFSNLVVDYLQAQ